MEQFVYHGDGQQKGPALFYFTGLRWENQSILTSPYISRREMGENDATKTYMIAGVPVRTDRVP